jgi:integrase
MGLVSKLFPNRGLRFPKTQEKPPFQTLAEIERRIKRGGLSAADAADLWDCAFLTLKDIGDLLEHVHRVALQPFLYPMFVFAAHTGARRSEIIRCQWDDVDFESGCVLLREQKRVKNVLSTRRVPLSPLLASVLKDWQKRHPEGSYTFCHDLSVVRSKTTRTGFGPLTRNEARDHFKRTIADSRWKNLRGWHCLRHSFASNCAAAGIDQRIINGWMGHQTEEMVKRYRHLLPDQQKDAIRKVFAGTS